MIFSSAHLPCIYPVRCECMYDMPPRGSKAWVQPVKEHSSSMEQVAARSWHSKHFIAHYWSAQHGAVRRHSMDKSVIGHVSIQCLTGKLASGLVALLQVLQNGSKTNQAGQRRVSLHFNPTLPCLAGSNIWYTQDKLPFRHPSPSICATPELSLASRNEVISNAACCCKQDYRNNVIKHTYTYNEGIETNSVPRGCSILSQDSSSM